MDSRASEKRARVKITPREKGAILTWSDFHARSRFPRSTIPEEKWGLLVVDSFSGLSKISPRRPSHKTTIKGIGWGEGGRGDVKKRVKFKIPYFLNCAQLERILR